MSGSIWDTYTHIATSLKDLRAGSRQRAARQKVGFPKRRRNKLKSKLTKVHPSQNNETNVSKLFCFRWMCEQEPKGNKVVLTNEDKESTVGVSTPHIDKCPTEKYLTEVYRNSVFPLNHPSSISIDVNKPSFENSDQLESILNIQPVSDIVCRQVEAQSRTSQSETTLMFHRSPLKKKMTRHGGANKLTTRVTESEMKPVNTHVGARDVKSKRNLGPLHRKTKRRDHPRSPLSLQTTTRPGSVIRSITIMEKGIDLHQTNNLNGRPLRLFDQRGMPLTDRHGKSLVDLMGKSLILVDGAGRPVCPTSGGKLYDAKGHSLSDPEFDPTVAPSKDHITDVLMDAKREHVLVLFDSAGNPLTSTCGEPLLDARGQSLLHLNYQTKLNISANPAAGETFTIRLVRNLSTNWKPPTPTGSQQPLQVFDRHGMPLTDELGHVLINQSAEPLLLCDDQGRPISDNKGQPILYAYGRSKSSEKDNEYTEDCIKSPTAIKTNPSMLKKYHLSSTPTAVPPPNHSVSTCSCRDKRRTKMASVTSLRTRKCIALRRAALRIDDMLQHMDVFGGPSEDVNGAPLYNEYGKPLIDRKGMQLYDCYGMPRTGANGVLLSPVDRKGLRSRLKAVDKPSPEQILHTIEPLLRNLKLAKNRGMPTDCFGRPKFDEFGRPLFDKYGRPLYDRYGRLVYDGYGRPLTDAFNRPLTDYIGRPLADDFGRILTDGWKPSGHVRKKDVYGRPLFDRYGRALFDDYGRPLYDLYTRPVYDARGRPITDAFGNVLKDTHGNPLVPLPPQYKDVGRLLRKGMSDVMAPIFLRSLVRDNVPVKDPFGGPLFDEMGRPLYNRAGKPTYDKYGRPLYDANGAPLADVMGRPLSSEARVSSSQTMLSVHDSLKLLALAPNTSQWVELHDYKRVLDSQPAEEDSSQLLAKKSHEFLYALTRVTRFASGKTMLEVLEAFNMDVKPTSSVSGSKGSKKSVRKWCSSVAKLGKLRHC